MSKKKYRFIFVLHATFTMLFKKNVIPNLSESKSRLSNIHVYVLMITLKPCGEDETIIFLLFLLEYTQSYPP